MLNAPIMPAGVLSGTLMKLPDRIGAPFKCSNASCSRSSIT
jgi:hypothetical protein